jgi:FkbM family methyltransferase
MGIKGQLKRVFEQVTGTQVYRTLPRGADFFADVRSVLPSSKAATIFDVGANVGQSADVYLVQFADAEIFCFEPIESTHRTLIDKYKGNMRVQCHRLALGQSSGHSKMVLGERSDLSYLVDDSNSNSATQAETELVEVNTLDGFCQANHIGHINFLKIDTEGGDLNVLRGATRMLLDDKIDLIQVEAGMNSRNKRHVPFEAIKSFLESYGYFLLIPGWPTGEPHLRRTNPVFVSSKTIRANRKIAKV